MAVVGVRQGECLDPVLVADDETIRNSAVHQLAQNEQAILRQVWTVPEQSANPLVMYRIGPPGMEESSARLPQVPLKTGIKDVCIDERGATIRD